MTSKTRKIRKSRKNHKVSNTNAKKGTQLKCLMKTCKSKKYASIYGSTGGSIRSTIGAYF